jgi:hypothetical protein
MCVYIYICMYIYIWRHYSSPRVMDRRFITRIQRSNQPTEPRVPNRTTLRAHPPRPGHPSDPASPVRPHTARSTPRLLTPRIPTPRRPTSPCPTSCPCLLRPTPPPLASTASCYASHHPATGERPYLPLPSLLPPAPLPPPPCASLPPSAVSSYTQRLSHRRPCLLHTLTK